MSAIEDIILRHSNRGMDLLRPAMSADFCCDAAQAMLALPRGTILLTTGFCVGNHAETDGPAGTWSVANALRRIGFHPVIVTDEYCRGIFEQEDLDTLYFPADGTAEQAKSLLQELHPVALFSLERCGLNFVHDYMNMRGVSIRSKTAPIDLLFTAAYGRIPTFGIGDGGNEIGMGCLADLIHAKLSIIPCMIPVDHLVIATVSNWGGYGLCAAMEAATGSRLMPSFHEIHAFMERAAAFGCVDGISGLPQLTEDGFPAEITQEILNALKASVSKLKEA